MAGKEEFLASIRSALGRSGQPLAPPFHASAAQQGDLIGRFSAELNKVGGRVICADSPQKLKEHLRQLIKPGAAVAISDGELLGRLRLKELIEGLSARLIISRAGDPNEHRRALLGADIGITAADYAIADTGTLVLISGSERHRLISLLPPIHICFLDTEKILADLGQFMRLARDRFYGGAAPLAMTFITGPSKTADIELTLSVGVHGPRELCVFLVAQSADRVMPWDGARRNPAPLRRSFELQSRAEEAQAEALKPILSHVAVANRC
jgi:L-lactate utilization protein LutC